MSLFSGFASGSVVELSEGMQPDVAAVRADLRDAVEHDVGLCALDDFAVGCFQKQERDVEIPELADADPFGTSADRAGGVVVFVEERYACHRERIHWRQLLTCGVDL